MSQLKKIGAVGALAIMAAFAGTGCVAQNDDVTEPEITMAADEQIDTPVVDDQKTENTGEAGQGFWGGWGGFGWRGFGWGGFGWGGFGWGGFGWGGFGFGGCGCGLGFGIPILGFGGCW
ncbi:Glycine-rich cell wall structural protein precursor [Minicystis rosea]|nr:Glycine-rich cell wall structural protein precursor [Minicystis rosea]